MPWLSLGGIALSNAFLTTVGRVGFGISSALPPRYVSFAIMLPIALLFLGAIILRAETTNTFRVSALVCVSVLGLLLILGSVHCLKYWIGFPHKRLLGKAAIDLSQVLDEDAGLKGHVHWAGANLVPRINVIDRLGYLHPPLVRTRKMSAIAASPTGENFGELTNFGRKEDGDLAAGGWAILPEQHRVADSVLLAYEDENGEWILFARTDVGSSMPAVSQRLDDDAYEFSGWLTSWKPELLPTGVHRISAWSFDADACRAYPIGAATL